MQYYDGIIFDLDGTLWQTKDSYLYAYHEVIKNHPEIKEVYTDDRVIATMGNQINVVAELVFPSETAEKKLLLIQECLKYSCNYLLENQQTIYPNVDIVLRKLSRQTKLFIVSNCPKEYIDVFFEKTKTKELFTDYGYLTIESDKQANVKKFIKKYNLSKVLLVGDSNDDFVVAEDLKIDFAYASYGYRDCKLFNYKLKDFSDLENIIDYLNYRTQVLSKCADYNILTYYDAQVVLMKNVFQKETDYIFGFWHFSAINLHNEILFTKLETLAKEKKTKKLLGPIDYATWFSYRLATDNFDWRLYPDINNNASQIHFLKNRGYKTHLTYVSTLSTIDQKLWETCKKIKLSAEYKVVVVEGTEAFKLIKDIYEISVDSFDNATLYTPISYEDFYTLYLKNISLANPDIVLIYNKDEPIAFSFCYEDINRQHYVSKTVGIKVKYQNKKLILKLIDESFKMMVKKGYNEVLYHFQNEQKHVLNGVWKNSALKQKHYALFVKEL